MAIDWVTTIEDEAARIVAAYEAEPGGKVPWSDRWTVGTVARHVAGTHHVVARILTERPTADFGLFSTLATPAKDDPAFPRWFADGTAALAAAVRSTPPDETCWSWYADGRTAGWWGRRMAHETLVHRWDAEAGAGREPAPIPTELAIDGIDEYLDVFVAATRALTSAPAGPTVLVACTDADEAWTLDLTTPGERRLGPPSSDCAATLRGPAEGLLLALWGRVDREAAGVSVDGDDAIVAEWSTLLPPM